MKTWIASGIILALGALAPRARAEELNWRPASPRAAQPNANAHARPDSSVRQAGAVPIVTLSRPVPLDPDVNGARITRRDSADVERANIIPISFGSSYIARAKTGDIRGSDNTFIFQPMPSGKADDKFEDIPVKPNPFRPGQVDLNPYLIANGGGDCQCLGESVCACPCDACSHHCRCCFGHRWLWATLRPYGIHPFRPWMWRLWRC